MADRYQEYFRFLERLGRVLDDLTAIEKEKMTAVRRDDLLGVQECMKHEQVLSLQLRSMDKDRERLLESLGLTGVPLSGLAEHCPEEIRLQARAAQEKLQNRYKVYRAASEAARTTLEVNLHEFEKFIAEDERNAPPRRLTDFRA